MNLLGWLRRRAGHTEERVETNDPRVMKERLVQSLYHQLNTQSIIEDGVKTDYGRLVVEMLAESLRRLETDVVWQCERFDDFIKIKSERDTILRILTIFGSSELEVRRIEDELYRLGTGRD